MVHRDAGGPVGPSDKEVVHALQRLASAHAHLVAAEREAEASGPPDASPRRVDDIEAAHTNLLWAQAQFITATKEHKAQKELDAAKAREKQVLRRHGYRSFRDYLAERAAPPTADVHLEVARREYESAQNDWDRLQTELLAAQEQGAPGGAATMVIDLTDGNPRRIA